MPMAAAPAASPATPSGPSVSTLAPWKDRRSCFAGVAWQGPVDWGFLVPCRGTACCEVILSFCCCAFPSTLEVRGSPQGHRLFLCTGGQQKVYFCIVLGEFEVTVLSQLQNKPHTKMMCSLPHLLAFASFEQMGSSENLGETNNAPRLFGVSVHLHN